MSVCITVQKQVKVNYKIILSSLILWSREPKRLMAYPFQSIKSKWFAQQSDFSQTKYRFSVQFWNTIASNASETRDIYLFRVSSVITISLENLM